MIFDLFAQFPLGEGFGINTNLLETNIINISVVLGVLIKVGGEVVIKTLTERKENILKSLSDADERFAEAQAKVSSAKTEIENAKSKAKLIRSQSLTNETKIVIAILENAQQEINRLQKSKKITIQLEEKKLVSEVYERVIGLVITQATKTIQQRLKRTPKFHSRLIEDRTVIIGAYKFSVTEPMVPKIRKKGKISRFYF
jgi:F-type H+-transporting ATPase subunit b